MTLRAGPADESAAKRRQRDEKVLADFGIPPSPDGALRYLSSLVPDDDPNAAIDRLIEQLGSDRFEDREQAAARLLSLPTLPRDKLEAALHSHDAEIRWRARVVLGRIGVGGNRALAAALRIVASDPPKEAVDVLLRLASIETVEPQRLGIHETLAEIVTPNDAPTLEAALKHRLPFIRVAAAYALLKVNENRGRDALGENLASKDARCALIAAQYLGNLGDRRALPALVRLMSEEDPVVACDSASFLSALTNQDFSFAPLGDRQAMIEQAQRFVKEEGATTPLTFPVAEPVIARGDLAGNTLVATGALGKVIELDATGKEVWRFDIVAWSAEKLPNRNVLIASYQSNQLLEVNGNGAVVWSRNGINAMRAKPLPNGHLLVADFGGYRVLELNEDREEVWSFKTPDNCFDAERLPNGHTVFCCPNLIREIDAEGRTMREVVIAGRANSLQVLANGHWLVANFSKNAVEEYDRAGKPECLLEEPSPCDALRLRSGKMLVASTRRAIEVSADGKTVREITETKYGCARQ
jgi:hypothetical protein